VIKIGNSVMFLTAGWGAHTAAVQGAVMPVSQYMYVEDVDAVLSTALESGASLIAAAADTFWGERCASVVDPFGHIWTLATRMENLKPEDIIERRKELLQAAQYDEALAGAETTEAKTEAA
jgi:PhnB protein